MSIWTSYSDSSERIVSPPFPITIPMKSGLVWIDWIRGACSARASRGSPIASGIHARSRAGGRLRLLERVPHDLLRHSADLDVHLERGDPLPRTGDLEVHVAQVILCALDVGEDDVIVTLLDEAHRDSGDGRLDRDAGVHQREGRAADRAHRRRAVRLERLRDEADRVREVVGRRDHRLERPLRQGAVADITPLRATHETRIPDRERRAVVVVPEAAGWLV